MRKAFPPYLIALAALAAAVLLRWLLEPVMQGTLPLVTLFGAVAIAVWIGGFRLAAVVGTLGYLACAYLFIEPRGTFGFGDARNFVGLLAYLLTCGIIIGFGEAMRIAHRRADVRREVLRVTLSCMGDAVITTDNDGRITSLNAVAQALTGWTEGTAIGQPLDTVFRIVNEQTRSPVESPAKRALREGVIVGLANHTLLISKEGSERPIDDSAAPILDSEGTLVGCVLIFRDITERRELERRAAQQLTAARFLASIVESSDDPIISKTLDSTIQSWNAAAERVFGHTAEQAIGRHISLIMPPDRLNEEDHIIARIRAGERVEHFETVRVRRDGTPINVSLTISPIRDDNGNVVGASKIARDITERKRIEADRQRLVSLVENSTDFIGICDMKFVPFYVNRAGLELVGLDSLDIACQTPVREFFFTEDQSRMMNEFFPSVMEHGDGEVEVRFRQFKTGAAIWMLYRVFALTDSDGNRIGLATVSRDITQRRQLEDDLRKLAAELSETNRRKDEFLAMLAHELRNPLAPILNGLQVLRLTVGNNGQATSAYDMMDRQLGQMVRLIDDLLDVSRITRGKIELKRERIDLVSVVNQAVEAVRPLCDNMGHHLAVDLPPKSLYLQGDPTRLAQVVGNLLTNACKFTEQGGKIGVKLEHDDTHGIIRVRDNGVGINPDQLPRIFEMFTQLDATLERSQGGLGIGLSLAKTLVEMHDGTIEAHSTGMGQGSEFIVRLPLLSDRVTPVPQSINTPQSHGGTPRRILVVDDNRDSAESLAMLLRLLNNDVHAAHDGVEAVEMATRLKPDLILMDIGLPKMNGYEACGRIREQSWGKQITLIALTGWGQDDDRRKSKEAGFDGHLVKPVEHAALTKLLADLVPKSR